MRAMIAGMDLKIFKEQRACLPRVGSNTEYCQYNYELIWCPSVCWGVYSVIVKLLTCYMWVNIGCRNLHRFIKLMVHSIHTCNWFWQSENQRTSSSWSKSILVVWVGIIGLFWVPYFINVQVTCVTDDKPSLVELCFRNSYISHFRTSRSYIELSSCRLFLSPHWGWWRRN